MNFNLITSKILPLTLVATLGVGLLSPITVTKAESLETYQSMGQDEYEKILQMTDVTWNETVSDNGDIEYTISDEQFIEYLIETGQQDILDKIENTNVKSSLAKASSSNVTKLVKQYSGNTYYYDLYLSKLVAQTLAVGGSAAVGFFISLIPGIGWTLAGTIVGAIATHLTVSSINSGKIVRFNKYWVYKSVRNQ
ncbi:hypothetical protein ACFVP8_16225 [Viridibacillus arvi]|uniref:hypothetical protein n=1 Tax=Viridibacillus arvi TaxID=263475 RepID=UPI00368BE0C3